MTSGCVIPRRLSALILLALLLAPAPAVAAISLVAHVAMTPAANNGGDTSGNPVDTTGSSLIVIEVAQYTGVSNCTPGDNKGNPYALAAQKNDGINNGKVLIWYNNIPTVGSNHIFNLNCNGSYSTFTVLTFSGTGISVPEFVATNSSTSGSTTTGSITPSANGSLIITASQATGNSVGGQTFSVGSGFTIQDQVPFNNGVYFGGASAWQVQGTAAAINPTWSYTGTVPGMSGVILDFIVSTKQQASKINTYDALNVGTSSAAGVSKIDSYPILNAGNASAMSVSKMNAYVILQQAPTHTTPLFHSFPP